MATRAVTIGLFVAGGLLVALLLAFFVSPWASSSPDGLEKVSADEGIDAGVEPHPLEDGPLADYAVEGVDDPRISTGLAGVIGVVVTFGLGLGLFALVRLGGRGGRGGRQPIGPDGASPTGPAAAAHP